MADQIDSCRKGDHALIGIIEIFLPDSGVSKVVRWCSGCGSVVVDYDVDGRTQPGAAVPMMYPELLKTTMKRGNAT